MLMTHCNALQKHARTRLLLWTLGLGVLDARLDALCCAELLVTGSKRRVGVCRLVEALTQIATLRFSPLPVHTRRNCTCNTAYSAPHRALNPARRASSSKWWMYQWLCGSTPAKTLVRTIAAAVGRCFQPFCSWSRTRILFLQCLLILLFVRGGLIEAQTMASLCGLICFFELPPQLVCFIAVHRSGCYVHACCRTQLMIALVASAGVSTCQCQSAHRPHGAPAPMLVRVYSEVARCASGRRTVSVRSACKLMNQNGRGITDCAVAQLAWAAPSPKVRVDTKTVRFGFKLMRDSTSVSIWQHHTTSSDPHFRAYSRK